MTPNEAIALRIIEQALTDAPALNLTKPADVALLVLTRLAAQFKQTRRQS